MSKRIAIKVLVLALAMCVVATLAIGCGNNAPATPAETTPPSADTQTEPAAPANPPADPIVLRVGYHEPPTSPFHYAWEEFDKQLQERTGGAAKLELYPSEQLGKGADMASLIVNGVADMGWIVCALHPNQFPVSEVIGLPLLGVPSSKVSASTLWDLYNANDEMRSEWSQGMQLICFTSSSVQTINTRDKRIEVPDDMKGLQIRVAGPIVTKYMETIGANPIGMPPPDLYEALDKGVLDGFTAEWNLINSYKLAEVTKYVLDMPFATFPQGIAMNQAKWDSLPPDIQAAFMELGGAAGTLFFSAALDSAAGPGVEAFNALEGREIVGISDDQKALWAEYAMPLREQWVSDMNAGGFDGQRIMDQMEEFLAKNIKEIGTSLN